MALTPPLLRSTRLDPLLLGLPIAAVAVAAWDPASNGGPPLCPFRGLTGLACPGCGLSRATGALLRGRLDDALQFHPLVLLVVVQAVVLWAISAVLWARGGSRQRLLQRAPGWVIPAWVAANTAVFVAVWVVRIASGSIDASA